MNYSDKYPKEVVDRLRELCAEHRYTADIAEILTKETGREYSRKSVRAFMKNHNIPNGIGGRFEKGHVPYTKGKKWDDYMSKESQEKSKSTCFKKGQKPPNMVPVGTRIIKPSDNKAWIKVMAEDSRGSRFCWRPEDRIVYESTTGKSIPRGYVLLHKNGDNLDCRFENLLLVPKAEATVLTVKGLLSEDPEIMNAALLTAKVAVKAKALTDKRREKKRMEKDAEQN